MKTSHYLLKHRFSGLFAVLLGFLAASLFTTSMKAATIDWGTGAQNINGDSDVLNVGSLVYAYNLGPSGVSATTINGVTFQSFAFPVNDTTSTTTIGNITFSESSGVLVSNNSSGSLAAPFSTLSTAYQALLSSVVFSATPATLTLTMSGLTSGQTYQFEWWRNTSGNATYTTASAGNSVALLGNNPSNANGGIGQFAIGTFTADSTSQSISYNGNNNPPFINGFELRAESVPEPSTYALLVGGVLVLSICRSRSQRESI